jgi:hypothetical protein
MKQVIESSPMLVSFIPKIENFGYPCEITVEPYENTRTAEQNRRMWAMLTDLSKQVIWYGKNLHPEDWKDVLTASLEALEVVPNIEGTGFVALGGRTSKMNKKRMAELIELIFAFGSEHDVKWSDPSDIINYLQENKK